jgi:hypothetical protein
MTPTYFQSSPDPRVPKIVGFDTELMNVDPERADAGFSACRALLREIDGIPANHGVVCEQDSGRMFLPGNAGSIYRDLDHLELAGPECRSAIDFVRQFHGMLGIANEATRRANSERSTPLRVHANNSDGQGNSWGGHLSVMVSRTAFDWIFRDRVHYLLWLASAQVSSIILTGAGEVGSLHRNTGAIYQISQRSNHLFCLASIDTTRVRPLVNTRNESLAGSRFGRLHCIFHDTTLCHTSLLLRAGLMQIFLAMIELEIIDPNLCFEEPLAAVWGFSNDPSLGAKARLLDGRQVTAVEHQLLLHDQARTLLERDGAVYIPDLTNILDTWQRMLEALRRDDRTLLSRHLDWVAKQALLDRAAHARALDLGDPAIKALDFAWSDLANGIYFALERGGAVECHASREDIARAAVEPPTDTRAYARSRLLRRFGGREGARIDWHELILARRAGKRLIVHLSDPGAGRTVHGDLDALENIELLQALGGYVENDAVQWSVTHPITTFVNQGENQ